MATVTKIGQIINNNNSEIEPSEIIKDVSIVKLAIQSIPGITFLINDDIPITIGYSGYYELEDEDIVITSIYVAKNGNPKKSTFYIDYIYEEYTDDVGGNS